MPDLADTLELLAERGADVLYGGELARALVAHVHESGGLITERDLAEYRVDPSAARPRLASAVTTSARTRRRRRAGS